MIVIPGEIGMVGLVLILGAIGFTAYLVLRKYAY